MAVDEKSLQPFGLGPQDTPYSPTEVLAPGEDTVTMVFTRKVILLTQQGKRVEFLPGVREVPASLAGHDWLARNGAQRYDTPAAKAAITTAQTVSEAQAAFNKAAEDLEIAKRAAAAVERAPVDLRSQEQIAADEAEKDAEKKLADAIDADDKAKAAAALAEAKKQQEAANAARQQPQNKRR